MAALFAVTLVVMAEDATIVYPVFPVVVLAAQQFRQPGAVVAAAVVSIAAVVFTASGEGPFARANPSVELLQTQMFVAVAALTALFVAAMRSEWERAVRAADRFGDSERKLAEAQALAHIGSWEWDVEANELSWSDELHRIFGVDPETLGTGYEELRELIHPEDRALVDATVRRAMEEGEGFRFQHRVSRPDGEIRTVDARGWVIQRDGRPVKVVGSAQDVTELQLAQERFRDLLEAAPDAMVIVDEGGRIVLVNGQAERLFGYTREELIGEEVEILIPEAKRGLHSKNRDRYVADAHPRPMGIGLDLAARRKDGTEFPVEISLSPLRTAEGVLISSAIRDVTERKLAAERLEHQALHDPLTDLPNRVLFLDRLDHALERSRRTGAKLAVYFCDLDQFKKVNDSLGHEAGDRLLIALPARLRRALRSADTLTRFGGDEFVILCEDLSSELDAIAIAERIAEAVARPFEIEGRTHHLSVSVGVVFVEGGTAGASEVVRDADAAMYRAKSMGPGRYELFDAAMRARLIERIETETGLRDAIRDGDLRLHYQPMLSLETDELIAVEALARWEHPERGLLGPDVFIDVAEESGLVVPLGEWVIDEACRQLAAWQQAPAGTRPAWVSINLSARQVADSKVVQVVASALERHRLDPSSVSLEITESALLADNAASHQAVEELKRLGVRLVLDDFGTGYSSLSYLKRFPIDALKIDRGFIDGIVKEEGDTAIVAAVLSMARALRLGVVAEGVENESQLAWLRSHGCDYAQGYLISPPVPPEEVVHLRPWRPDPHAKRRHRPSRPLVSRRPA